MKCYSITQLPAGNGETKLLVEGDMTIQAEGLKGELLNALSNSQRISLQLKNVNKLDLTALQLLAAFSKSAILQSKSVELNFEPTEYVVGIVSMCGFDNFLSPLQ